MPVDTPLLIPSIPSDAPFSADQKVWLAGFLAGLHTRLLADPGAGAGARGAPAGLPLKVLYGSQTGNAEALAHTVAEHAGAHGLAADIVALDDVVLDEMAQWRRVIVVTSTYGEGEMPDNAQLFWQALQASTAPRMEGLHYAVLALGDTGYDGFCQAGKLIDMRLEQLGAQRLAERIDCDVDYEAAAEGWLEQAVPALAGVAAGEGETAAAPARPAAGASAAPSAPAAPAYNRKNPLAAPLAVNRRLSGPDSGKDIRHFEFDLGDSGLSYEAGDALGVLPLNDPALVALLLEQLGAGAGQAVAGHDLPLGELLTRRLEIGAPSRELIHYAGQHAGDAALSHILAHGDKEALAAWLWGKDVLDLVAMCPSAARAAEAVLPLLKPLQHRAYSISSSPLAHPGQVHLTVASVRYRAGGRDRGGVCSTYLADRVAEQGAVGIFASPNKAFRVPADPKAPMIMVGPGTGIAPFRAFLAQRQASGAAGRNWLFFGDQHRASDFIYESELQAFKQAGTLHRLDLAFSRDQSEKIYVQTRMREHGSELYAWLQEGGHFYVCGDASRMARDVDEALHAVIGAHGGLSAEQAAEYVNGLKREKRYVRDVY